jgi:hypothetical protein
VVFARVVHPCPRSKGSNVEHPCYIDHWQSTWSSGNGLSVAKMRWHWKIDLLVFQKPSTGANDGYNGTSELEIYEHWRSLYIICLGLSVDGRPSQLLNVYNRVEDVCVLNIMSFMMHES